MRCLVTGASGFLGRAAVKALLTRDVEVAILLRGEMPASLQTYSDRLHIIRGTLSDTDSYKSGLLAFQPKTLLHMAWTGVAGSERNDPVQADNITAAQELATLCAQGGVQHIVNAGSQAEYGLLESRISESDPTFPTTLYGHAKIATCQIMQKICIEQQIKFAHLRVFSTYGPESQPYWLLPYVITELLAGRKPLLTKCEQRWDFLFAPEAGEAFAATVEARAEGLFNLGSGSEVTINALAETVKAILGKADIAIQHEAPRPGDVLRLCADATKARALCGFAPRVNLREGLVKLYAWIQSLEESPEQLLEHDRFRNWEV